MSPPPEQECLDQMICARNSSLADSLPEKVVEAWACRPCSTAQQIQEAFTGSEDAWFRKQFELNSSILEQAFLQRELSAKMELSSSSENINPSSFAENLNRCKSTNAYSNMGTPFYQANQISAGVRALQTRSFHQSIDSNTGIPITTSDRVSQPGSPFNNSSASNKMATVAGDVGSCISKPSTETGRFPIHASSVIPEDSDLAFGSRGTTESGTHSSWVRTTSESQAALSAQASVGTGATKVSKRRSRASAKPPITVLSADTTNFRAMVQSLTGIPASSPMQPSRFYFCDAPTMTSIFTPHTSPPAQSIPGLPTLDTSAFFLLGGASTLNQNAAFLQNDSLLQGIPHVLNNSLSGSLDGCLGLKRGRHLNPYNSDSFIAASLRETLSNQRLGRRECSFDQVKYNMDLSQGMLSDKADNGQLNSRQVANLESFLLGNDSFDYPTRTPHSVDSWLPYDGVNAPAMELAHSA